MLLYYRFSSALLSWILSRVLKASVEFCVGGCSSLQDVVIKFEQVFSSSPFADFFFFSKFIILK
jgi:hypothetical protein